MKGEMDFRVLARPNNENPSYSLSVSYRKETLKKCIITVLLGSMLPKNCIKIPHSGICIEKT